MISVKWLKKSKCTVIESLANSLKISCLCYRLQLLFKEIKAKSLWPGIMVMPLPPPWATWPVHSLLGKYVDSSPCLLSPVPADETSYLKPIGGSKCAPIQRSNNTQPLCTVIRCQGRRKLVGLGKKEIGSLIKSSAWGYKERPNCEKGQSLFLVQPILWGHE